MDNIYFPPAEAAGGWRITPPSDVGINAAKLEDAINYHAKHPVLTEQYGGSIVVIYRGHLIGERYTTGAVGGPQPWDKSTCNDMKSSTKSVFGTAVGVFLDEYRDQVQLDTLLVGNGRDDSLIPQIWDQPLTDPRKTQIKIKHALSMTSGHETREPWLAPSARSHFSGYEGAFQLFEYCFGWWAFEDIPNHHTLKFEPGTEFNYSNYGLEQVGLAMRNLTGEELAPYVYDRVLGPLGMAPELGSNVYHHMPYTDEKELNFSQQPGWGRQGSTGCNAYGSDESSSPYGYNAIAGSTFRCSARDFARLGYLWLRRGLWNGQQLVPAEWIDLATRRYVRDDGSTPSNYGYTFWIQDDWDGVPKDTYMARGHNLNDCYVVPSLDLVVVRQGNENGSRSESDEFSAELIRRIVAAVNG